MEEDIQCLLAVKIQPPIPPNPSTTSSRTTVPLQHPPIVRSDTMLLTQVMLTCKHGRLRNLQRHTWISTESFLAPSTPRLANWGGLLR